MRRRVTQLDALLVRPGIDSRTLISSHGCPPSPVIASIEPLLRIERMAAIQRLRLRSRDGWSMRPANPHAVS